MTRALLVLGIMSWLVGGTVRAQDLRTDEDREQEPVTTGGAAVRSPAGFMVEPRLLTNAINAGFERFGETGTPSNGFYFELSNMITGSGWVSIGPGYRREIANRTGFVDASAAVSWHGYNMLQSRVEFPNIASRRLNVGAQAMWEDDTQVDYYGIGSHSNPQNKSQFRVQTVDTVGYATLRLVPSLSLTGELGFLRRPDVLTPGGTFNPGDPTTFELFPRDPGVSDAFQPNYVHNEISVTSDTRDHRSRPTSGGYYRAALSTFIDQSSSTGTFSFRRYEGEGAQFIPVTTDGEWVVVLHAWGVWTDLAPGHDVPFYLLPSLGGNNTLRSYPDYRFHDLNMAVVNAESRWMVFTHMDATLFFDAGNVAARFQDLDLAKRSYGGGVRFHTDHTTFARIDVAYGGEGWQLVFRTADPFRFSRLTRRVAPVPFVP